MRAIHLLCCLGLALLASVASPARGADIPAIAAAADLKFALAEIAAAFERSSGRRLKLSFGSSGNLMGGTVADLAGSAGRV